MDCKQLLGEHIQLARKARKLTEKDLAERVGISRTTFQKIEKGDLKCELGIALEAAALVGVKLFGVDAREDTFASKLESVADKLLRFFLKVFVMALVLVR